MNTCEYLPPCRTLHWQLMGFCPRCLDQNPKACQTRPLESGRELRLAPLALWLFGGSVLPAGGRCYYLTAVHQWPESGHSPAVVHLCKIQKTSIRLRQRNSIIIDLANCTGYFREAMLRKLNPVDSWNWIHYQAETESQGTSSHRLPVMVKIASAYYQWHAFMRKHFLRVGGDLWRTPANIPWPSCRHINTMTRCHEACTPDSLVG